MCLINQQYNITLEYLTGGLVLVRMDVNVVLCIFNITGFLYLFWRIGQACFRVILRGVQNQHCFCARRNAN